MNIELLIKYISPFILLTMGFMCKYATKESGWYSYRKFGIYLIVLGVLNLALDIIKYVLQS